jgi:hypothetical protein
LLDGLFGSPAYWRIVDEHREKFTADQMREIEQTVSLLPRIREWVALPKVAETFRIGIVDFTFTWQSPADHARVFSIEPDFKVATASLLISGRQTPDQEQSMIEALNPLFVFMNTLSQFLPADDVNDNRKFRLVGLTRRPLLASVFWPPYSPFESSVARTIQLEIAHAFFRLKGDMQ